MPSKIYVGNLSYSTTDETLKNTFTNYGEVVSAVIIRDRYTQQSKGFGFVEMSDEQAAEAAIGGLNNQELDGRRLRVNHAENKPRDQKRSFNHDRPSYGGGNY